jgi:hypothetical protein
MATRLTSRLAAWVVALVAGVAEHEHDGEGLGHVDARSCAAGESTISGSPEHRARRNCVRSEP